MIRHGPCSIGGGVLSRAWVPTSGAVGVTCGCQPDPALLADSAFLLPGFPSVIQTGHRLTARYRDRSVIVRKEEGDGAAAQQPQ